MKWLVRPYEATEWKETDIEPTDELRRFLEFKPNPAVERSPRHYDSFGYCDNPGRGY